MKKLREIGGINLVELRKEFLQLYQVESLEKSRKDFRDISLEKSSGKPLDELRKKPQENNLNFFLNNQKQSRKTSKELLNECF